MRNYDREVFYFETEEIEKMLIGRTVSVEGDTLILDNGIELEIVPNDGCGGCSAGWYELDELNEMPNAITNVEFVECDVKKPWGDDHVYQIFVLGFDTRVKLLSVSGDDGNGYYGSGYYIRVRNPNNSMQSEVE